MLASPLPPFFLDIYSLSMSSLGCKALCIIISFLVFRSICWSSLVHTKNGPEYLTRGTAQVFTSSKRLLLYSIVSSSFLVLLRYSFLIFFFHPHMFNGVCFQYSQLVSFFFPERSDFFYLVVPFLPTFVVYHFSLLAWHIFLCQIYIYISWLYILTASIGSIIIIIIIIPCEFYPPV